MRLFPALLLAAALAGPGCSSRQKVFKVTSYPQGATLYIDEVPRGQTDMDRLSVDFTKKEQVILRLEKEGFQSTGRVLKFESDRFQFFPLEQAPNSQKIIETLNAQRRTLEEIQRTLQTFLNQVTEERKKSQPEGKE